MIELPARKNLDSGQRRQNKRAPEHGDRLPPPARRGDKPRVVVIEDEPDISELLVTIFDAEGYIALAAGDAESGLRLARSTKPSVITLDLCLPGRDGHEVLSELKREVATRDIPVIVVSANSDLLRPDFRRLAAAILQKPFDLTELLITARRFAQA